MRAFVINPAEKSIQSVELEDGLAGIRRLIGFDEVDSDEIDASGDRLFFDESCFIRKQDKPGRFKLDQLAPVAGRGVVVGSASDGAELAPAATKLEALKQRVTFM